MNKKQIALGKKLISLLLIFVILFSYMPVNAVYAIVEELNADSENNSIIVSNEENNIIDEEGSTIENNSIVNDALNESSDEVSENETEINITENDIVNNSSGDILKDSTEESNENSVELPLVEDVKTENNVKEDNSLTDIDDTGINQVDVNTVMVNQIEVNGTIEWKDNSNAYGTRVESVKVNLLKDENVIKEITIEPDELGNWTYKFENLEKYDENGIEINYSISEIEVPGYEISINENNITNKLVGTTKLTGSVNWDDSENAYGTRPESIVVNLYKNYEEASIMSLGVGPDKFGNWNFSFDNLEKYDENGVEINYTVIENKIDNYEISIEKLNQTEIKITNKKIEEVDFNFTWQEILEYGPYISMAVKYAEECGKTVSAEEKYIYEQYKDLVYVQGAELAAIAMINGTDGFTEKELAIYNAFQEIVINGGEKNPISTLSTIIGTDSAIINNGTKVLKYLKNDGNIVHNSIKYVDTNGNGAIEDGDRVAYCVNYTRSYNNNATYEGTSWDDINNGEYGPVYKKLYSELSYVISIGCKEAGTGNLSAYSTNTGNWEEDYYVTQTVIYIIINDYTTFDSLKEIVNSIDGLNFDDNQIEALRQHIYSTFTGHPSNKLTENTSETNANKVKSAVTKMYSAVNNYRANIYNQENADGYDGTIIIKSDSPTLKYENGKYVATVTVVTTGKTTSDISLNVPAGMTVERDGNTFKLSVSKSKIGNAKEFKITASADFDMSRTITYISKVSGTQNIAFFQDVGENITTKVATSTITGPETVTIEGSKTWKDNNDVEGKRPTQITIKLLANGNVVETKNVTKGDEWKWEFVGYPKYDEIGNEIVYSISEDDIANYTEEINGYNAINTISVKTQIGVTKIWKDNNNSYNTRPSQITVKLYKNGNEFKTATLTSANSVGNNQWSYTFINLDKYDENGKLINYTIKEDSVQNYTTEINGTIITNTLTGKTELSGSKIWYDNNNFYNTRPDSIIVKLIENGIYNNNYIEVKEGTSKNWSFIFDKLNKYDSDGKEIIYEIKEDNIPWNYVSRVDGTNLINTLTGKVDVSVQKIWKDNDNSYNTRPEDITVNLLANGEKLSEAILNEANNWSYKFKELEKYDTLGVEIEYTITENVIEEKSEGRYVNDIQKSEESDENEIKYELINTLTDEIEVNGTKIWKDNENAYLTRPENITINLLKENEVINSVVVEPDEDGNWSYKFENLDKYDENGVKINYTITENELEENLVGKYESTIEKITETDTEIVIDVTNKLTGETELSGNKNWKDNNNSYNTRPESIIVNLLANGQKIDEMEVTKGADGNWNFSFNNLLKYDNEGKLIVYTINENKVANYITAIKETSLTNTLTGKTELSGIKIWKDNNNSYNTRPESIVVKLLANGEVIDEITVMADENGDWIYKFEDLEKYDENGVEIEYTILENPVAGYITDIDGVNLINTLIYNNTNRTRIIELDPAPKTGRRNLLTFFTVTAVISLAGIVILSKKQENK